MKIKYSYIIPTFNRKTLLLETIASVLKQVRDDYEIIIVDDGSSDGTESAFNSVYSEAKNISFYRKVNEGVSVARNFGALKAKGKYLIFLDSDDLISDTQLSCLDKAQTKYKDATVFFTSYWFWNSKSGDLKERRKVKSGRYMTFFKDFLLGVQPCFPGCVCLRKTAFDSSIRFLEGCNFGEDQALWVDLFYNNYVVSIDDCTFYYRCDSEGSLSKRKIHKLPPDINAAINLLQQGFEDYSCIKYISYRLASFFIYAIKTGSMILLMQIVMFIYKMPKVFYYFMGSVFSILLKRIYR